MNSSTKLYLQRLLTGRYDELTEPPPLRTLDALESKAKRILASAGAGLHVPGRCIAVALGYSLLPRRPPNTCGEAAQAGTIAYDPTLPEEEQSVLCAHGTAHLTLDADHEPYSHADVWLLTCLLLVPRAAAQTMTAAELAARSKCPAWLSVAMRSFFERWDSGGVSVSCKRYSENA